MDNVILDFQRQAEWCLANGSPFTGELLERACKNIVENGNVAKIVAGWGDATRADAVALRFAGAINSAVLNGHQPELAAVYPEPGRDWRMAEVWPLVETYIHAHRETVVTFMQSPPQTNETGRSGGLAPAFMWLAQRAGSRFHMLELGASAGLNLYWDQFRYAYPGWRRADGDGPLIPTKVDGVLPPWRDLDIVSRAGCDQAPADPGDDDDRRRLLSYVWSDQFDRVERLAGAMRLAAGAQWRVEPGDAAAWIAARLEAGLPEGMTVVYHSVFYQYPPEAIRHAIAASIERAGEHATPERQLAWVRLEPESALRPKERSERFVVDVRLWDGAGHQNVTLAEIDPHGKAMTWFDQPEIHAA